MTTATQVPGRSELLYKPIPGYDDWQIIAIDGVTMDKWRGCVVSVQGPDGVEDGTVSEGPHCVLLALIDALRFALPWPIDVAGFDLLADFVHLP